MTSQYNIAAYYLQVLSTSVAEAFAYENKPYTRETERFVRIFDKFFDLMNVRSLKEGIYKRKPNLKPYRNDSGSKERLQVPLSL